MIYLNTYQKVYNKCEDILDILGVAASHEVLRFLLINHTVGSMNITPQGITYYFKQQGYQSRKYYQTKPQIFFSKHYSGVLLHD